jgi:hypothetical protein
MNGPLRRSNRELVSVPPHWFQLIVGTCSQRKMLNHCAARKTELDAGLTFSASAAISYRRQLRLRNFHGLSAKVTTDYALTVVNKDDA